MKIEEFNSLDLGKQGENKAKTIVINCTKWLSEYPEAAINVIVQRPNEDTVYPADASLQGNNLVWTINGGDTAIAGVGKAEIRLTDGEVIKKTITVKTYIAQGIIGDETVPPPAEPSFINDVLNARAEQFEIVGNHLFVYKVDGTTEDLGEIGGGVSSVNGRTGDVTGLAEQLEVNSKIAEINIKLDGKANVITKQLDNIDVIDGIPYPTFSYEEFNELVQYLEEPDTVCVLKWYDPIDVNLHTFSATSAGYNKITVLFDGKIIEYTLSGDEVVATIPSSSGMPQWELIEEMTLDEDATSVSKNIDNYKELFVFLELKKATTNGKWRLTVNNVYLGALANTISATYATTYSTAHVYFIGNSAMFEASQTTNSKRNAGNVARSGGMVTPFTDVRSINFETQDSVFANTSKIIIYGRK